MADAFDEGLKAGGYQGERGELPGLGLPPDVHGTIIDPSVVVVALFGPNDVTVTEGPVLHRLGHTDPDARAAAVLRIARLLPEHLRAAADRIEREGLTL